jgi:hypothetical protein
VMIRTAGHPVQFATTRTRYRMNCITKALTWQNY